jgi:hypothetical protein
MKTVLKITSFVVLVVLFLAFAYFSFYKWRQMQRYDDRITITAWYMKYACGDCTLDMKVESVDNSNYRFIVGKEIFPHASSAPSGTLCDYIGQQSFENSLSSPDAVEKPFIITGYLHKYSHGLPFIKCS